MIRAILLVLCAAGLSGCFTSNVVVTVRPDGSGTVEHTATIRPADLLAFDKLASPDLLANAQHPSEIARQFQKDAEKANQAPASPPPADTEIFLASLLVKGEKLTVGPPVNITNSPGYDNQPSFTPDGNRILFASVRESLAASRDRTSPAEPRTPATDIFRYDIASHAISRITDTPDGEFSPIVMPNGKDISVVRVEPDGTQRLWRIATAENTKDVSSIILRDIKPVGYYAWIDDRTLALYVLGQGEKPSTLHVADAQTGNSQVMATGIGRSIQRMPSGHVSFITRQPSTAANSSAGLSLHQLFNTSEPVGFRTELLTSVPSGISEPYVAWLADGSALVAADTTLYRWRRGETSWTAVANLAAFGLHGVTRLAISPKGDRIAIVASAK